MRIPDFSVGADQFWRNLGRETKDQWQPTPTVHDPNPPLTMEEAPSVTGTADPAIIKLIVPTAEATATGARVTQVVAETLQAQTATLRASQLIAEVLLPVTVPSRVSQVVAEILDVGRRPVRVTQLLVEVLARRSLYCGIPDITAAILCGRADVLAWLEWTVPGRTVGSPPEIPVTEYVYAAVDLPDPSTYYGGFKDARVLSFGTATRSLSDLTGQWSANDVTVRVADVDRDVRATLIGASALRDTLAALRLISDADRRLQAVPTTVFRGALRGWRPIGDLSVELEYTDAVGLRLARRGVDRQLPSRLVTVADFPNAPASSQAKPIPIVYGIHELYDGACPLLYVGPLDIGLGEMHTWVVAGHACVEVDLLLDGVMLNGEPPFGTTWFCPPGQGEPPFSGWTLPTPYVDLNGRRYTLVQGTGADPDAVVAGSKTLTANVYGIEGTGDGSGSLIEQSFLQYLHFFRHFVLDSYEGGLWPTTPIEWESGWCQINAQTFADAQLESRRWVPGDGYVGKAYIGPERRSVRDWLALWNTSLNCRLGQNRYHQWIVSLLPGALTASEVDALPMLTDAQDVHQGTLDMEALDEHAITRATIYAYQVPKDSGLYGGAETFVDRQTEADAGEPISADLYLPFLGSTDQIEGPRPTLLGPSAEDAAKRWLAFRTGGMIYRLRFDVGLCAYEAVDVGELFTFRHFADISATGSTRRILWCESIALDIDQRAATVTALDVTHAYEGTRTLELLLEPSTEEEPPIGSTSGMAAPTGAVVTLVDAAVGSAYYGLPDTPVCYKVVAVFDSGEESKPVIVGPVITNSDGGSRTSKRAHVRWDAYPTAAQTNPAGASVVPVGMRIYRSATPDFEGDVQQADRERYPIPEQPANVSVSNGGGSGTTYYYWVRQYYYLSGVSEDGPDYDVESGATPDVYVAWDEDPAVNQLAIGTPSDYADGVFVQQVFGRTDTGGGHAGRYLTVGLMGDYHDDGRDTEKGGGGIDPFPAVPTGSDLPLTATSFYDQWPGKQDEADNPWVSI